MQPYQNLLAIEMSTKFIASVKSKASIRPEAHSSEEICDWLLAEAHFQKLSSLRKVEVYPKKRELAKILANIIISLVQGKGFDGDSSSERYLFLQGYAYDTLGVYHRPKGIGIGTEKDLQTELEYYEKSKIYFTIIGDKDPEGLRNAEMKISNTKALLSKKDIDYDAINDNCVAVLKEDYEEMVESHGKEMVDTIRAGTKYAKFLKKYNGIKAERILEELFAISKRVNRIDHKSAKDVQVLLDDFSRRFGILRGPTGFNIVQILGYLGNAYEMCAFCVGRLEEGFDKERVFMAKVEDMTICPQIPVMCRGLRKAELNGLVAEIKEYDQKTKRYQTKFEDESLKPVLIRRTLSFCLICHPHLQTKVKRHEAFNSGSHALISGNP
ncbi:hypothetical protein ACHAWF_010980 [Thalassiosira exigua]